MKTFSLILFAIGCVSVLFYGNMHWQERTSSADSRPHPKQTDTAGVNDVEDTIPDYHALISNWPDEAQTTFLNHLKSDSPYRLALVGSTALGGGENGWSEQVKAAIETAFDGNIKVAIHEYDTTSIDFVNGEAADEVLEEDPDLVLLEPFSLSDNSNLVGTQNNQESIEIFQRKLKDQNEDAVLILQPTHPIAGATYYPKQIEELQTFADTNNIPYLDHWSAWPQEDATLSDYVVASQETPNDKGHEVWADYLINYFIAE